MLCPSETTKVIRAHKLAVVSEQCRTKEELQRELNAVAVRLFKGELDRILKEAIAANTVKLTHAKNVLEKDLMAVWEDFCESTVKHALWADNMPEMVRELTKRKINESLDGFLAMMSRSLRDFESLCHRSIV
jgi:hypothetical protein